MTRPSHKGNCPWCKEDVRPTLFEENPEYQRNIFVCPDCGEKILKCVTPGCEEYARWGEQWDDFFCPECTAEGGPIAYPIKIAKSIIGVLGPGKRISKK